MDTQQLSIKIKQVKKELGITNNDIAGFFGYKNGHTFACSHRKNHVYNGIIKIYELTKSSNN